MPYNVLMANHVKLYVWDGATRLSPNGIHSGVDITIQNLDSIHPIYIGGQGVSSNDFGYKLAAGNAISFELPGNDSLYAYADNEVEVAVLSTGLEVGN